MFKTCKADGREYVPRSIYLLLTDLQRHMRKLNPATEINIMFSFKLLKMFAKVCLINNYIVKGIALKLK